MTDLNATLTKDSVLLINAICKGMPLEFATRFMTRIPQLLEAVDRIGWVHDELPEVKLGSAEYFNAVIVGEDGKECVLGCMGYLNRYEVNILCIEARKDWESCIEVVEDQYAGTSIFYTGWALSEFDSYEGIDKWDFIKADRLIAWRELPKYSGLKSR